MSDNERPTQTDLLGFKIHHDEETGRTTISRSETPPGFDPTKDLPATELVKKMVQEFVGEDIEVCDEFFREFLKLSPPWLKELVEKEKA